MEKNFPKGGRKWKKISTHNTTKNKAWKKISKHKNQTEDQNINALCSRESFF